MHALIVAIIVVVWVGLIAHTAASVMRRRRRIATSVTEFRRARDAMARRSALASIRGGGRRGRPADPGNRLLRRPPP